MKNWIIIEHIRIILNHAWISIETLIADVITMTQKQHRFKLIFWTLIWYIIIKTIKEFSKSLNLLIKLIFSVSVKFACNISISTYKKLQFIFQNQAFKKKFSIMNNFLNLSVESAEITYVCSWYKIYLNVKNSYINILNFW